MCVTVHVLVSVCMCFSVCACICVCMCVCVREYVRVFSMCVTNIDRHMYK